MKTASRTSLLNRYDYSQRPDEGKRYQLIEGSLVLEEAPSSDHQLIVGNLHYLIRRHLAAHPIGVLYFSPLDTYLSELNVFQPDLLFVRKNQARLVEAHGVEGPPTLVVEVLSLSTRKNDLGPKRVVYARAGVKEMWVVDPEDRTVAVYRLPVDPEEPHATYEGTAEFSTPVLPKLNVRLAEVFAAL